MAKKKNSSRVKKSTTKKVPIKAEIIDDEAGPIDFSRKKINRRGRDNYFCPFCSFGTYSPSALEEHKNSHTGMRPFKCDQCPKSFTRRSALWNHRRLHINQRPFKCELCPKTFKWKNSLIVHLRVHAKKTPMSRKVDEINQSIDKLKSTTYAGYLRGNTKTPVLKFGEKSTMEYYPSNQAAYGLPTTTNDDEKMKMEFRNPMPFEFGPADFIQFDSAEDQAKFEKLFEECEREDEAKSTIRAVETELEEDYVSNGVTYEVIARGFESLSSEGSAGKSDMEHGQSPQSIIDNQPGPSGIGVIVATSEAINYDDDGHVENELPIEMDFDDASSVRVVPISMW